MVRTAVSSSSAAASWVRPSRASVARKASGVISVLRCRCPLTAILSPRQYDGITRRDIFFGQTVSPDRVMRCHMANPYRSQIEPAEGPADTPDEEQGEQGQGKLSRQEAGYRMGNPMVSCGLCANFTGSAGSDPFQCTAVEGEISPFGFSDSYTRQDNPFLAGTQSDYGEGEAETPTEQAAPDEEPEPPSLQIGNRRYT